MSMDTIVFFYKKRGAGRPWAEPVGLKTYMLIRVPMDMGEEWPGRKGCGGTAEDSRPGACRSLEEPPGGRSIFGRLWAALPHPLRKLWQRRRDRVRQRQEEREALEREALMRESMEGLSREIAELAGEDGNCYAVYEDSLERKISPLWKEYFQAPRFQGYTRRFWVELLMEEAVWPRFVVLGTAECLPEVMEKYAHRMKSLSWILPEGSCDLALQDFVEDFYLEYGLAVTIKTFHPVSSAPWRREGALAAGFLAGGPPASILDFTGEPCLLLPAAEGSVWLDMMSMEEKKRRIEAKGAGIAYFSLKEKWRRAQKRCSGPVLP